MSLANTDRVAYGDAILDRLSDPAPPPVLKADHIQFKKRHASFLALNGAVDPCRRAFEKANALLATADARRDKTILELANKMPAAGLGSRQSPFGGFSKYAPTKIVDLPYAAEIAEVRKLVAAIRDAAPPADIQKLLARTADENEAVAAALKALTKPASALNQARAHRDAGIPDWDKALRHLKDAAKVAFRDDPGRYDTVFRRPRSRPDQHSPQAPPNEAISSRHPSSGRRPREPARPEEGKAPLPPQVTPVPAAVTPGRKQHGRYGWPDSRGAVPGGGRPLQGRRSLW
jgi:hypothetical protein